MAVSGVYRRIGGRYSRLLLGSVGAVALAAGSVSSLAGEAWATGGVVKPSMGITVSGAACTLGFVFTNKSGHAVSLVARGCGPVGSRVKDRDGAALGAVAARSATTGLSRVDLTTRQTVYADVDEIGPVTGVLGVDDLNATRPLLCVRAAHTGLRCGEIVGRAREDRVRFSAPSASGDAGAPVYALTRTGNVLAVGVLVDEHAGGEDDPSVAAPVAAVMQEWSLSVAPS